MDTLRKILKADAVYVYDPNGYVGKTTCYELGVLISKRKPLYFFEMPKDLPLPISQKQIVTPDEFTRIVCNDLVRYELPNNLSASGISTFSNVFGHQRHTLVMCGSMQFYGVMQQLQEQFAMEGIRTVIPANEDGIINSLSDEEFDRFKRQVSNSYLRKIRDKHTKAVLIVNQEKHGIANYIGANTLVEIGMAFTWGKKIFILNGYYPPLKDELRAWSCEPLNGNLAKLIDFFCQQGEESSTDIRQLTIFDNDIGLF